MENVNIESAVYEINIATNEVSSITAIIEGQQIGVPLDPANRHYAEIMRQVDAGELVIQEADTPE